MPTFRDLTFGNADRPVPLYHTVDLRRSVGAAVRRLYAEDHSLILGNVNEMTLTFRLGMYLQQTFSQYDVDCEYNKNLGGPKSTPYTAEGYSARPDVVVHLRGANFPTNLIVVEAKRVGENLSPEDLAKVRYFVFGDGITNPYRYQLGVILLFKSHAFDIEFIERDA
jgi:hypothetical protein